MAAPVTELVDMTLGADRAAGLAALAGARRTLLAQPGCRAARFSAQHEDAGRVTLFVDWDAVSSHAAFVADTAAFGPMRAALAALQPGAPYHAALDPAPPAVLDAAPAVEVLHLYFPADAGLEREQAALATLREFADVTRAAAAGLVGVPALGWVVEERPWTDGRPARVALLLVGWRAVDAHLAYRETDAFKGSIGMLRGLDGLLGMSMYHVSCAET